MSDEDEQMAPTEQAEVVRLVRSVGRSVSVQGIHVRIGREWSVAVQRHLLADQCSGKVYFRPRLVVGLLQVLHHLIYYRDIRETQAKSLQSCCDPKHIPALPENVLGMIIDMDLWDRLGNDPLLVTRDRIKSYRKRARELFCVSKTFLVGRIIIIFEGVSPNAAIQRVASSLVCRFADICLPKAPLHVLKMLMENIDVVSSVNILILSRLEDAKFSIKPFFRSQIRGNKKEEIACREIISSLRSVRHLYVDTEFETILNHMPDESKRGVRCLRLQLTTEVFRQRTLVQFKNLTTLVLHADQGCSSVDTSDIHGRPSFDRLETLKMCIRNHHFDVIGLIQCCE